MNNKDKKLQRRAKNREDGLQSAHSNQKSDLEESISCIQKINILFDQLHCPATKIA